MMLLQYIVDSCSHIQYADFGISAIIAAAIAATVTIATSATGFALSAKEAAKMQIDDIMFNYVYMQGVSLESMKNAHIKLYRTNKKDFEKIYQYYASKRVQDMANGTHEGQKKMNQNRVLSIILICIIVVVVFLIVSTLIKKR